VYVERATRQEVRKVPDEPLERIERELTLLIRRAMKLRLPIPGSEGQTLDRSAYAILARLYHGGPHRLTALADVFELDISTVSRQVQVLWKAGLVERATDPVDRRAALLTLSRAGQELVESYQARRHRRIQIAIDAWPEADREVFATLLERFNAGMAIARARSPEPTDAVPTTQTQSPAV
jgi:DNA-binding MarR family transcriptional regulator